LRRSVLDRTGAFDEDRKIIGIEDWELWARMSFHCPIVCRRKLLVHYRRHGGNFPLAGIRLRYPRMIEALLRNLPLTEAQRLEVHQISAQRLVEYAEELIVLKELQAARYCLDAAANFHPPVANGEMFHQLLAKVPASVVPQK